MQRIQTKLTALLGNNVVTPIVIPPMAGAAGGNLAGQVSLGGGYGFVGSGPISAAGFTAELEAVRKILDLPQDAPLPVGSGHLAWLMDKGKSVDCLDVALEKRVQSVWLSFGDNLGKWVNYVRQFDQQRPESTKHKTLIWILVNSLEEAQKAVKDLKPDVLVVQGSEAGGHGHSQALPLISLLPLIKDAIPDAPPLVAAGGIANGPQVAGLLAMGADGCVMGTRFLATPESIYSPNQKKAVIEGTKTVRTIVFDEVRGSVGWPDGVDGRAIPNKTLDEANEGAEIGDWRKRYEEATKNDDTSRRAVWSGSSIGLVNEIKGAKILLEEIHGETVAALIRASQYL